MQNSQPTIISVFLALLSTADLLNRKVKIFYAHPKYFAEIGKTLAGVAFEKSGLTVFNIPLQADKYVDGVEAILEK